MSSKCCKKCGLEKPLTEYHLDTRSRNPRARCKVCTNADNVARAAANPEKATARTNAWRLANPGRTSANIRAWQIRNPERSKRHSIWTQFRVEFEHLWQAQGGLCASCQNPMLKEGKEPNSVCVDHDRSCCSGKKSCGKCVRGLIHRNCNLMLGYANDDPAILRSAIAYLERWGVQKPVNP